MPYSLPKSLDKKGGRGSDDIVSDFERDKLLAFEEQEELFSATILSSLGPLRRSTEPLQNYSDGQSQAEIIRTRTEEPRNEPQLRTSDKDEEAVAAAAASQQGPEEI